MAMAGSAGTEEGGGAAEVTVDDLNLLDALNVEEGGGEEEGKGGGDEAAAKAEADKAAADEAAKAEADAKAKADEEDAAAAKAKSEEKGKGDEEDDAKWYQENITDDNLVKFADQFESRDALLETVANIQKALGIEPTKDWLQSIGDEKLRDHAARFTSPTDMAKAHLDLRTQLSQALVFPGKNASKEDREAFAGKLAKMLGVPKTPEGYEFPAPEKGVEVTEADKLAQTSWAKFFHEIHLPKKHADAILARFAEETKEGEAALAKEDERFAEKTEAELQREWGDQYDTNKTLAMRAGQELFGESFEDIMAAEMANGRMLMDSAFMLRGLAKIGREMSEGNVDVMTDQERETIDDQIKDVRQRAADAQSKGDTRLANKLFAQEQELLKKVVGNKPIVGAQSRTA